MLLFAANLCKRFFSRSIKPAKAKARPKAGTALKDRANKHGADEESAEKPPAKRVKKVKEPPAESSAAEPKSKAASKPKTKRKAKK